MFPASSVHISKSIILIYNMAYYVYINGGRELKMHCPIPADPWLFPIFQDLFLIRKAFVSWPCYHKRRYSIMRAFFSSYIEYYRQFSADIKINIYMIDSSFAGPWRAEGTGQSKSDLILCYSFIIIIINKIVRVFDWKWNLSQAMISIMLLHLPGWASFEDNNGISKWKILYF